MIILLHVLGGSAAFALSIYMLKIASPRDGVRAPFLKNGVVNACYLFAILTLFFGGATWVIWGLTRLL